jgi:tryptophan synthase alpha chain
MNRLDQLFQTKKDTLNIYLTAGFPNLEDTISIVKTLSNNGVDMVEIGMPFSDPLADGPTIQKSSQIAIENGITLNIIFEQVKEIRKTIDFPIVLMGYYNQIIKYGDVAFFEKAKAVGVDGFIIPDLPIPIFKNQYKNLFNQLELKISFLITPQTTDERIRMIAKENTGFLYVVSSYSITGSQLDIQEKQTAYFERIKALKLSCPKLLGFGISNKQTVAIANQHFDGAIIGSAFIKAIQNGPSVESNINDYINSVL